MINNIKGKWNVAAYNNFNGVRPPEPSTIAIKPLESTPVPYEQIPETRFTIYTIDSREPYAAETLITKYGQQETRVGTNLGR